MTPKLFRLDVVVPAPQRHQIGPLIASPHRHLVKRPRAAWRHRFHQNGSSRRQQPLKLSAALSRLIMLPRWTQDPGTDRGGVPRRSITCLVRGILDEQPYSASRRRLPTSQIVRRGSRFSKPNRTDQQPESHRPRVAQLQHLSPHLPSRHDGRDALKLRGACKVCRTAGDSSITPYEKQGHSSMNNSRWLAGWLATSPPTTSPNTFATKSSKSSQKSQQHKM